MKRPTALVMAAAATLTLAASTTAAATPAAGLKSELLVRSAAGEFRLADRDMRFFLRAGSPTDIALVRATLDPGGETGWHTHPGRSMVMVETGQMTTQEAHHRNCVTNTVPAGQGFEHPEGPHNFINRGTDQLVFYVTYFVPAGATPLLLDTTPPRACL